MGKIQAVRVGSEAHISRAEIERLLSQTDERLLMPSACVSGHDERPDLEGRNCFFAFRSPDESGAWPAT
jgi:hypothetical protein